MDAGLAKKAGWKRRAGGPKLEANSDHLHKRVFVTDNRHHCRNKCLGGIEGFNPPANGEKYRE
jgi:hypothetical protein